MYTEFFGLKEKPFELTPSPRFLYMSESHREALALLTYGVMEQKGFVLLTGEVGTGKTTMVHVLLSGLDKSINCIYLTNPLLSGKDLLRYLALSAFGKNVRFKSKAQFLVAFEEFLKRSSQHQRKFLMIIDEAQRLSFELLEEIRLFSNLETDERKLINIFLIGQPELNENLSDPRCRPLLQRISIRHHLAPLSLPETREYVATRLKVAGAKDPAYFFHETVVRALHECSSGYPRLINILADNALLLAYARGKKKITAAMVRACHEERRIEFMSPHSNAPAAEEISESELPRRRQVWKWVLAALLLLFLAGLAIGPKGRGELFRVMDDSGAWSRSFLQDTLMAPKQRLKMPPPRLEAPGTAREEVKDRTPDPAPVPREDAPKDGPASSGAPATADHPSSGEKAGGKEDLTALDNRPAEGAAAALQTQPEQPAPTLSEEMEEEEKAPYREVIVKSGDTLIQLASSVYGFADDKVLALIQEHNSRIRDIDRIDVGQKIVFPSLSESYQGPTFAVHIATYVNFQNAQALFQKLLSQGIEAYIVPVYRPEKGKVYRVAAGSFTRSEEADQFAGLILNRGISDYAKTIRMEVK